MNTRVYSLVVAGLMGLFGAAGLQADITAGNDSRLPTAVAAGSNLQDILNYIYQCDGCVDANEDQQSASMFKPSTKPGLLAPSVVVEFSTSLGVEFGLWSGTNASNLVLAPVFNGSAVGATGDFPTSATLKWNTSGTQLKVSGDGDPGVTGGLYSFDPNAFGFYVKNGGQYWYSDDELNTGGSPQMLAYLGGNGGTSAGAWTLAFENSVYAPNADFTDFVVKIESMAAVPEPGSIFLLGTVLLAVFSFMRVRLVP